MAKRGRPTKYTPEVADEICRRLALGESLRSICKAEDMPDFSTVSRWAIDDRDGFYQRYAQARDIGLDYMADETLEIADDGSNDFFETDKGPVLDKEAVMRSRLRVDTRKWYLSKLAPKRYGDKVAMEHTGKDGGPIQTESRVTDLTDEELQEMLRDASGPSG